MISAFPATRPALAVRTLPRALHPFRVLDVERVALLAVRPSTPPLGYRIGAPDVLHGRDRFEVRRIHTGPVRAQMVEEEPARNRANVDLVREAVGHRVAPADAHSPVPARLASAEPRPAPILGDDDATHEAASRIPAGRGSCVFRAAAMRARILSMASARGEGMVASHRENQPPGVAPPELALAGAISPHFTRSGGCSW